MLRSVPEVLRPAVEVPRYTQTHLPVKGMVVGTWGRLLVKSSEKWMGPTFRVAISTCWGDEHTMVMRGGGVGGRGEEREDKRRKDKCSST